MNYCIPCFCLDTCFLVEKSEEKLCTKWGFAENMCPLSGREALTDESKTNPNRLFVLLELLTTESFSDMDQARKREP
jgi:hypothetical protein